MLGFFVWQDCLIVGFWVHGGAVGCCWGDFYGFDDFFCLFFWGGRFGVFGGFGIFENEFYGFSRGFLILGVDVFICF